VPIDGPSGAYNDDRERIEGSEPEKSWSNAGRPADRQPAEIRSRGEYYEALRTVNMRVATTEGPESAANTVRTRPAWDSQSAGDHPDPPPLESLRVAPERAGHILDGDR
jgi:hypothetical protein